MANVISYTKPGLIDYNKTLLVDSNVAGSTVKLTTSSNNPVSGNQTFLPETKSPVTSATSVISTNTTNTASNPEKPKYKNTFLIAAAIVLLIGILISLISDEK